MAVLNINNTVNNYAADSIIIKQSGHCCSSILFVSHIVVIYFPPFPLSFICSVLRVSILRIILQFVFCRYRMFLYGILCCFFLFMYSRYTDGLFRYNMFVVVKFSHPIIKSIAIFCRGIYPYATYRTCRLTLSYDISEHSCS